MPPSTAVQTAVLAASIAVQTAAVAAPSIAVRTAAVHPFIAAWAPQFVLTSLYSPKTRAKGTTHVSHTHTPWAWITASSTYTIHSVPTKHLPVCFFYSCSWHKPMLKESFLNGSSYPWLSLPLLCLLMKLSVLHLSMLCPATPPTRLPCQIWEEHLVTHMVNITCSCSWCKCSPYH